MTIRGLAVALNSSGRYAFRNPEMAVDHLVIGAGMYQWIDKDVLILAYEVHVGVVGLAVTQRLAQKYPDKSTYLVERNSRVGEETR